MRADYLERFRPLFTAGLKRLAESGAVFTHAMYRHACNETGPGHSVLLSGRSPRSSGIVGNTWYDRTLRQRVNVVDDPAVRLVGSSRGRAASPAQYNAFTVGDMLKASSPLSRVVGVSFKDRAAILPAGRRADGAYWYQATDGRFVTSSWYTDRTPGWLESWNARKLVDALAGRAWERLLPDTASYLRFAGEDAVDGEFDRKDIVFPHAIRGVPPAFEFYDSLRRTPFADEVLLDFAVAAMKGHDLGRDEATDILSVSFSASDVIGHSYARQPEQMDNMLRSPHARPAARRSREARRSGPRAGSALRRPRRHAARRGAEGARHRRAARGLRRAAPAGRAGARRALPGQDRPRRRPRPDGVRARPRGDRAPRPEAGGRRDDDARRSSAAASWRPCTRRRSSWAPSRPTTRSSTATSAPSSPPAAAT
jgi:hypothetical protein